MKASGIAAGPANPKEIRTRAGDAKTVLELQVLEDTAGVLLLQIWDADPQQTRRMLDVKRGELVQFDVARISVFGDSVRCEPVKGTLSVNTTNGLHSS